MNYYDLRPILKCNAIFNFIVGERSNGKTYQCLLYALQRYVKYGYQVAIIRRFREDFKSKRGAQMWGTLVKNELGENNVKKLTHGEYDSITYYAGRWFLSKWDSKLQKYINAPEPFAYSFALTEVEHDKSTSYENIRTIIFDEVLTRDGYIQAGGGEWVLFQNCLSTIVRNKGPEDGFKIFMLGNTVNKYCPYFAEMHLNTGENNIRTIKQGEIRVYKYGNSGLTLAFEYCSPAAKKGKKKSDVFFAFSDNQAAQMITQGAWEIGNYPHNTVKYGKKDIIFQYFILWDDRILQCEIVSKDDNMFTFIHQKTTDIQDPKRDIIFSIEHVQQPNYFRNIARGATKLQKKLWWFFQSENVYYQDNEIGELVNNYLQWCLSER